MDWASDPIQRNQRCYRWRFLSVSRISHRAHVLDFHTDSSPVTENLNQWYAAGDQAYILVASAMVLVMIPGLAFLYSGLARRKSALSMIWACMFSASVITFQWYFWGYSLAFGPSTNGFIGNLDRFGLKGVLGAPSPGSPLIPELLYSFYQVSRMKPSKPNLPNTLRCNSALLPLPLSSDAWLNVVA